MKNNIKNMLFGCLLGDAHRAKSGKNKAFITFEQTIQHKDYIVDIYQKLKDAGLDLHEIKYYTRSDARYSKSNDSIYFKTYNNEALFTLAEMFLSKDNNKILPVNIEHYLEPETLAFWICDDGQLVKNGGITLCTDNYTNLEVELLMEALVNRYNLNCSIQKKKVKKGKLYHRIYIKKNYFDILKPFIIQYVHKSFLYKLHIN